MQNSEKNCLILVTACPKKFRTKIEFLKKRKVWGGAVIILIMSWKTVCLYWYLSNSPEKIFSGKLNFKKSFLRDKEEKLDSQNLQMRNNEKDNLQKQQKLEESCENYLHQIQALKEGNASSNS